MPDRRIPRASRAAAGGTHENARRARSIARAGYLLAAGVIAALALAGGLEEDTSSPVAAAAHRSLVADPLATPYLAIDPGWLAGGNAKGFGLPRELEMEDSPGFWETQSGLLDLPPRRIRTRNPAAALIAPTDRSSFRDRYTHFRGHARAPPV